MFQYNNNNNNNNNMIFSKDWSASRDLSF